MQIIQGDKSTLIKYMDGDRVLKEMEKFDRDIRRGRILYSNPDINKLKEAVKKLSR